MCNLLLAVGIAILTALNILDMITTRRMIDSGKGFERNPVMASLFKLLPKQLCGCRSWPSFLRSSGCGLSAGLTALLVCGSVVCATWL